jgi:hypothetical protein
MTSRLYAQIRKNFPEFNLLPETSDTAEAAQAPAPDAAPDGTVAKPGTSEPQPTQNGASESNASQGQADAGSGASQTKSQSPEDSAEKGIRKVNGLRELIGVASGEPIFLNIECTVDAEGAREVAEIVARADSQFNPVRWMPLPVNLETFGTTGELFTRVQRAIAERAHLPDRESALLTFWVFSTWFKEVLSVAPCLLITGRPQEGETVLSTLRAFSSRPHPLAGLTSQSLKTVTWVYYPTLLISEPNLGKRMAVFLGCSTCRGYVAMGYDGGRVDHFGSKAIYLGEDLPMKSMPQNCLHINASTNPKVESQHAPPPSEEKAQSIRNQLLYYRVQNFRSVFKSDFSVTGLSPESNAIASALGKCIVDAPELQKQLLSLLAPNSQQEMAERLDDLGTLVVGAAFNLCHTDKTRLLVGEIAHEVNRILRDRGERLQFSAEKVGHKLKKLGLFTQRLGGAGNGLLLDHATQVLLHEMAGTYGLEGLNETDENLHCPLCPE